MKKKSRLKVYGVLGYPVKHSFSPSMHNAALRALGIKATYKLFEIKPSELENFISGLKENNIWGFNVTIPYKEKILGYLNGRLAAAVKVIGAANTVKVGPGGKLSGLNTDFLGFSRHLAELKFKPHKVALVGAGGAARAICYALAKKQAREVVIYDIDRFRSIALGERFKKSFPSTNFIAAGSIEELNLADKDLLVNATPVGMKPEDPCLFSARVLHRELFVYDLIYNPARTKLLELAASLGLSYSNGLGMLLYQAIVPFKEWTGRSAPLALMRMALEKELAKCRK